MASLHRRHASVVNTAFEQWPQSDDAKLHPRSRSRTPLGHNRGRSLGSTEKGDPGAEPLLSRLPRGIPTVRAKLRGNTRLASLWLLSLLLTSLLTYVCTTRSVSSGFLGSFATGYVTELRSALPYIRVHKQHLYGALDFRDGHAFIPDGSPSLKYIGTGAKVDEAWDKLTEGRYFLLTDDEARAAYGNPPARYWNSRHGGYVSGLDVFHTLYCLSRLRQTLYPDHYTQDSQSDLAGHEHCIDHLRQLTMCNVDLTPVPTQWYGGLNRNHINASREHTCRDFWQVRDWAKERFDGSLRVKPRTRDGRERSEFYGPWEP